MVTYNVEAWRKHKRVLDATRRYAQKLKKELEFIADVSPSEPEEIVNRICKSSEAAWVDITGLSPRPGLAKSVQVATSNNLGLGDICQILLDVYLNGDKEAGDSVKAECDPMLDLDVLDALEVTRSAIIAGGATKKQIRRLLTSARCAGAKRLTVRIAQEDACVSLARIAHEISDVPNDATWVTRIGSRMKLWCVSWHGGLGWLRLPIYPKFEYEKEVILDFGSWPCPRVSYVRSKSS